MAIIDVFNEAQRKHDNKTKEYRDKLSPEERAAFEQHSQQLRGRGNAELIVSLSSLAAHAAHLAQYNPRFMDVLHDHIKEIANLYEQLISGQITDEQYFTYIGAANNATTQVLNHGSAQMAAREAHVEQQKKEMYGP